MRHVEILSYADAGLLCTALQLSKPLRQHLLSDRMGYCCTQLTGNRQTCLYASALDSKRIRKQHHLTQQKRDQHNGCAKISHLLLGKTEPLNPTKHQNSSQSTNLQRSNTALVHTTNPQIIILFFRSSNYQLGHSPAP